MAKLEAARGLGIEVVIVDPDALRRRRAVESVWPRSACDYGAVEFRTDTNVE